VLITGEYAGSSAAAIGAPLCSNAETRFGKRGCDEKISAHVTQNPVSVSTWYAKRRGST
jgi:hypothetical protein